MSANYYTDLNREKTELGEGKSTARLRNARDRLHSIQHLLPKSGVCDVGCGEGSFLSVLREKGYEQCWGIEPSTYAYNLAVHNKLDVVQGNISDLPRVRKERVSNALTLFHVIEHLPEPIEALRSLKSLLPPRGALVLETPDGDAPVQKATDHQNELVYPEHLFYWTEGSLRKALELTEFEVLLVRRRSFDWKHTPIRVSLLRLGILRDRVNSSTVGISPRTGVETSLESRRGGVVRGLVRTVLAHLVHLLQRDDYLLVVARRR